MFKVFLFRDLVEIKGSDSDFSINTQRPLLNEVSFMTVSCGERKRCHVSPEIGQLLLILHFCFFCHISRRGQGFQESKAAVANRQGVMKTIKLSEA